MVIPYIQNTKKKCHWNKIRTSTKKKKLNLKKEIHKNELLQCNICQLTKQFMKYLLWPTGIYHKQKYIYIYIYILYMDINKNNKQ